MAGGSVLQSLTQSDGGLESAFKDSDVDLFLYGVSSEEAMVKLHAINTHLMSKAKAARTKVSTNSYSYNDRYSWLECPAARKEAEAERGRAEAADLLYARTKGSVTFVVGGISVQVILRLYKSRPEVLMAFDLDSCAVGYDGKSVWALPRARRALNGRFNLIDETRPNVKYEARLFKYSERGFAVGVPGMRPNRENVDMDTYISRIDDLSGLGLRSP